MAAVTPPRLDYVIDIETEAWDRYVLGGFYDGVSFEAYDWRHEDKFFHRIAGLPKGAQVWAWNGGRFDWIWWVDKALKLGIDATITFAGPGMSRIDVRDGPILRDGVRLYPASLDKSARLYGAAKEPTGLPCTCGRCDQGKNFCRITRRMDAAELAALTEYCRHDCVLAWRSVETVLSALEENGFDVRGTIGGTAWATARALCDVKNAEWSSSYLYRRARAGYYGGRVQVFRPVVQDAIGHRYDINSAYPAALDALDLPIGEPILLDAADAALAYANGTLGVYDCSVDVPRNTFVPPLPYRTQERIAYPVGRVVGSWTTVHLLNAEQHGAKIHQFGGAIVWVDSAPILRPYQRKVWELRDSAPDKEWRGLWKWYANSVTGKLAQQPDHELMLLNPRWSDIKRCDPEDCRGWCSPKACCPHRCVGRCGAWIPKDPRGRVWARKTWRIAGSGYVQWAAYLTSHAGVELHNQLVSVADGRDAVYCDTDSVYALTERTHRIGDGLGEWGYDGRFANWGSLGPKSYAYDDPDEQDPSKHRIVKAKGMQGITAETLRRMLSGEDVAHTSDRGVMSVKQALQKHRKDGGSLLRRKRLVRRSHADFKHFGDRILQADGLTYPQTVRELSRHGKKP